MWYIDLVGNWKLNLCLITTTSQRHFPKLSSEVYIIIRTSSYTSHPEDTIFLYIFFSLFIIKKKEYKDYKNIVLKGVKYLSSLAHHVCIIFIYASLVNIHNHMFRKWFEWRSKVSKDKLGGPIAAMSPWLFSLLMVVRVI